MKIVISLAAIVSLVLLTSCQRIVPASATPVGELHQLITQNSIASHQAIETIHPSTATVTPVKRITPTPNRTPTYTATPTISPESNLHFQCMEFDSQPPGDTEATRLIWLDHGDPYQFDMTTGLITRIGDENKNISNLAVSLDKKLLAYKAAMVDLNQKVISRELVISEADNIVIKTLPWEQDWSDIPGWVSDQRLVIHSLRSRKSLVELEATFLVLDVNNNNRQILQPVFPEIYDLTDMVDWNRWSITMYDPSLTRLIYLRSPAPLEYSLSLYDLQTKKILFDLENYIWEANPSWSPDGSRLVVEHYLQDQNALELLLISRDGQIDQLTKLNGYQYTDFLSYSWSPDGRYIAAWYSRDSWTKIETVNLVLIDVETFDVTDYCFQVRYSNKQSGLEHPKAPIWSPNGDKLIVWGWAPTDQRLVYLIDPFEGSAFQIAKDVEPVGWMLAP